MKEELSKATRTESDLIGEREVPETALYGVQTLRGIENFRISKYHLCEYPLFINALAITKMGAAMANFELGLLTEEQANAILHACKEILEGKHHDQFPVDMIQGGAGTTTNMNANEVIANRALELMGHKRGEYQYCSPNDHVNRSQSTNDAYPTAIHIGMYYTHLKLVKHFKEVIGAFRRKAEEFAHVIKMGRTQLEDAVPMTLGQTFNGFASILQDEIKNLDNGSWFNKKFQTVRIPTLEEVLKVCRGKIRLNIEIKPSGHDKDLEEQVAKLLKEYHMRDTCVVSSLKYESLQKVKEADSSIETVYITSVSYGNFTDLEYADGYSVESTMLSQSFVNRAQKAGKQVYVWTVNSEDQLEKVVGMGIDNVITDDPVMAKELIYKQDHSTFWDRYVNQLLSIGN